MKMLTKALSLALIGGIFLIGGADGQQRKRGTPPRVTVQGTGNSSITTFKDGKLTSSLLGLTLLIPPEFSTITLAEAEILDDAGKDLMFKEGVARKKAEEAISGSIKVGAFSHKPYGEPNNSAIEIVAVIQPRGITAKVVLAANVALMKDSNFTLTRSFPETKIGANTFSIAEFEGIFGEIKLTQRMYVIMNRGFSIVIASTHHNAEQLEINERVIGTMELN